MFLSGIAPENRDSLLETPSFYAPIQGFVQPEIAAKIVVNASLLLGLYHCAAAL